MGISFTTVTCKCALHGQGGGERWLMAGEKQKKNTGDRRRKRQERNGGKGARITGKNWIEWWHGMSWVEGGETECCACSPAHTHPSFSLIPFSESFCSAASQRSGRGKSAPCSRSLLQMSLRLHPNELFTQPLLHSWQSKTCRATSLSSSMDLKPNRRNTASSKHHCSRDLVALSGKNCTGWNNKVNNVIAKFVPQMSFPVKPLLLNKLPEVVKQWIRSDWQQDFLSAFLYSEKDINEHQSNMC